MLTPALLRALEDVAPTRRDEPLSRHTTIGIGGPADAYVSPASSEQLRRVLCLAHEAGAPVFILGSGSNIVVGDAGIRGITIENRTQSLDGPFHVSGEPVEEDDPGPAAQHDDVPRPSAAGGDEVLPIPPTSTEGRDPRYRFRADSGCSFAGVSRQLSFAGYAGLEWACGIPGTIGGAVVYNAGAYGGCLGDVLLRIGVWDEREGEQIYAAADLGLVYRGSAFTRGLMSGKAVLWAEFALWPGDADELRTRIAEYDGRRLNAQPRGRNAGSFFKNPPDQPAWRLLDAVGMRGYQVGGAQFSDKHCNFLINAGGASAADVAALKHEAQSRVRERFGIVLDNEVKFVGEGFGDA
jgi:UDP-N-acetylmuramate dehydrogenase